MSSPLNLQAPGSSCDQVQDQLSAYRNGEGSPLARQRVEAHLQHCASCQALFDLQGELAQAARQGPVAMNPQRKQRILQSIHQQIDVDTQAQTESQSTWPGLFSPLRTAAMAASFGLLLGFIVLRALPYPTTQGWIKAGPGIEAYAYGPSRVHFKYGPNAVPQLVIDQGALLIRFTRPVASPPLEVLSGDTRVIVRGTVFFVARQGEQSQVGVRRGKVEVQAVGQNKAMMVHKGQAISIHQKRFKSLAASNPYMLQLNDLFPHFIIEAPAKNILSKVRKRTKMNAAIDRAAVTREIDAKQNALRKCYEHALKRDSSLSGEMTLELHINELGQVEQMQFLKSEIRSSDMQECMQAHIENWQFNTKSIYSTSLKIPLSFRQGLKALP